MIALGIENSVKEKYGADYWQENKKKILKRANRNGALDAQPSVSINSRERRKIARASERGEEIEQIRRKLKHPGSRRRLSGLLNRLAELTQPF